MLKSEALETHRKKNDIFAEFIKLLSRKANKNETQRISN